MNFDFFKKNLNYILLLVLIVFIGYELYNSNNNYDDELLQIDTSDDKSFSYVDDKGENDIQIESSDENSQELYVHISGAVKNPGLYKMTPGSRIADAIDEAGGSLPDANLDAINLARKLNDEDKIYLPTVDEEVPSEINSTTSSPSSSGSLININSADKSTLTNIPGVGDKTADKIIDYREKTQFKSIEDIKNVDGIGDKKFENMKDFITT